MAKDPETTAQEGLDVLEITRMPGWQLIEAALQERLNDRVADRDELLAKIGSEDQGVLTDLTHRVARLNGEITGLEAIADIISIMLRRKTEAEGKLR